MTLYATVAHVVPTHPSAYRAWPAVPLPAAGVPRCSVAAQSSALAAVATVVRRAQVGWFEGQFRVVYQWLDVIQ
jgi:hypothetical protein